MNLLISHEVKEERRVRHNAKTARQMTRDAFELRRRSPMTDLGQLVRFEADAAIISSKVPAHAAFDGNIDGSNNK